MKKIMVCVILVFIVLFVCFFITDAVINEVLSEKQYQTLKYKIDDSTENLIDLCNTLGVNKDIEFLEYVDILINRPDFKDVYVNSDESLSWYQYNDILILQAFKCVTWSCNGDLLESVIKDYFPKVQMSEPLAHLSYALTENSEFANENKLSIINSIVDLYDSSTKEEKQRYLEYIVAYYKYHGIDNETSQFYFNELNNLLKNMTNYERKFCYSNVAFAQSCWQCMLTGVYNDEINEYYYTMFLESMEN